MADAIALSMAAQFETERIGRLIDSTDDPGQLRRICHMMLQGWMTQRAASEWAIRQSTTPPQAPAMAADLTPPWDDPLR